DTRAVFQEATSERGKKRALATTTRQLVWNAVPSDTTECYDRVRDPAEEHDIWKRARDGSDDGSGAALARSLKRLVGGLGLPAGAAGKLARAVRPPGGAAPAPTHPLQAALGDVVRVRGYDASGESVVAGGALEVTVHFEVAKRIPPGWRLFFHLEGPGGFRNLDHVPVEGMMPLERWRPGQTIRDSQRIAMPAGSNPGTYT